MAPARRTTLLLASILATILACLGLLVPPTSATGRSPTTSHLGAISLATADCQEHASAPSSTIGIAEAGTCRALCAAQAPSGAAPKAEVASGRVIDRYYDPNTGQFLSVDPDVDQTNQPYAYTGGDPVNGTDPNGQMYVGPDGQSACGTLVCVEQSADEVDAAAEAYEATAGSGGIVALGSYLLGQLKSDYCNDSSPGGPTVDYLRGLAGCASPPTFAASSCQSEGAFGAALKSGSTEEDALQALADAGIDVPQNYIGRPADPGPGWVFQPPGAAGNRNAIRAMEEGADPRYPYGYWRIYNDALPDGQPITADGRPGSQPDTHFPFPPDVDG